MKMGHAKRNLVSLKNEHRNINGKGSRTQETFEPKVSVVLPFVDSKKHTILIERQYRQALRKYIYELPAGHVEEGETPREAAIREMQEETGFAPERVYFMYKAYHTPSSSSKLFYCFLSVGLTDGNAKFHKDPDEVIKIENIGLKKVLNMIKSGKIMDNKTIAAVLYYEKYYEKFIANR